MADTASSTTIRPEPRGGQARRSEQTIERMKQELDRVQSLIDTAHRTFEADPYVHSDPA